VLGGWYIKDFCQRNYFVTRRLILLVFFLVLWRSHRNHGMSITQWDMRSFALVWLDIGSFCFLLRAVALWVARPEWDVCLTIMCCFVLLWHKGGGRKSFFFSLFRVVSFTSHSMRLFVLSTQGKRVWPQLFDIHLPIYCMCVCLGVVLWLNSFVGL
jgi:hypothetical protein